MSILAVPLLVALVLFMTPNTRTWVGEIDSFVYTGYMLNLEPLIERFGVTYYMLRMAAIVPGSIAYHFFGVQSGFLLLHYVFIAAAAVSMFLIVQRFFDASLALLSSVLLLFSPWYLRSNVWDYVDGFVLTYLLAGLAFSIAPRRDRIIWSVCAGSCMALATNANLYAVAVWVPFYISWLIVHAEYNVRLIIRKVIAFGVGFVAAYACLALAVNSARPGLGPFFEGYTIHVATRLLEGGSISYFEPLGPFIGKGNYYVLVPLLLAVTGCVLVVAARAKRRRAEERVTTIFLLYLIAMILIYTINHFAFHSPRITKPYYFCYLLIPSYLTLIALIGWVRPRVHPNVGNIMLPVAGALSIILWRLYPELAPSAIVAEWLLAALIILIAAAAASYLARPTVSFGCFLAFAVLLPAVFVAAPSDYNELFEANGTAYGTDVFVGTARLVQSVESLSPPSAGRAAFWYNWHLNKHYFLLSMQSAYLFAYSLLDSNAPKVTPAVRSGLNGSQELVILGTTEKEVTEALDSLERAGIQTRVSGTSTYTGPLVRYTITVAKVSQIEGEHGPIVLSIPTLSLINVSRYASLSGVENGAIELKTDPRQWAYSFETNLRPSVHRIKGPIKICLAALARSGAIGVGLTKPGSISTFVAEIEIDKSSELSEYCLPALNATRIGYLVIRNLSASNASTGLLKSITVNRP